MVRNGVPDGVRRGHDAVVPRVESTINVPVPVEVAFAVSQTYGEARYRWDDFVKEQHLLDGATGAGKGVRTATKSKHGLTMVSQYVTYRPPTHVGMKMVKGPWFFSSFSGGWNFSACNDGTTDATWRYNFVVRPSWLRVVGDRIGTRMLGRDIDRRLAGFAKGCVDPVVVAAATEGPHAAPSA